MKKQRDSWDASGSNGMAGASTPSWRGIGVFGLISAILAACGVQVGFAQCQYAIVEPIIQAPSCGVGGPPATTPTGLNSHGHVVGHYAHCSISGHAFGFIWKPGTGMVTLPMVDGMVSLRPADINDAGVIVGTFRIPDMGHRGFAWDPATQTYTYLEPLHDGVVAHTVSSISAVNNAGVAVGSRVISEPGDPVVSNAVIWHPFGIDGEGPEVVIDLGVGDGPSSGAEDGNSGTDAVGWSGSAWFSSNAKALLWTNKGVLELGALPGATQSAGFGLNDRLEAIGTSRNPDPGGGGSPVHGFYWRLGVMIELAPPPPFERFHPTGIAPTGQVAGFFVPAPNVAGLWQHGDFHELMPLIANPPPQLSLSSPGAINGNGQIASAGALGSKTVGVLLTPINVPTGDLNFDCKVDFHDLLYLLSEWGKPGSSADLNGDGTVGVPDLLILLANWGS